MLRVLRTITSVPSLRRIVNALFMAIPTISSVIILMSIIFTCTPSSVRCSSPPSRRNTSATCSSAF
ncbi:hypothetical protein PO124_13790 [Bacillus licheniformis]|nr:hypothetical protein [Bacillus licheniformis]